MSAKEILLQLLADATRKNIKLGKTQLTKLLYLTEVEYFRENGKRLTDVEWFFHHYGPYAFELEALLDGKEFERVERKTNEGHELLQYKIGAPVKHVNKYVDPSINIVTRRVVQQWGSKHLKELIDYVYLKTEPMKSVAMRGEKLDFTTIPRTRKRH